MLGMGKTTRKVRNPQNYSGTISSNAVKFTHYRKGVVEMLKQMIGLNQNELIIGKRVWQLVQIMANIRPGVGDKIHIHVSALFKLATTKIQFIHFHITSRFFEQ